MKERWATGLSDLLLYGTAVLLVEAVKQSLNRAECFCKLHIEQILLAVRISVFPEGAWAHLIVEFVKSLKLLSDSIFGFHSASFPGHCGIARRAGGPVALLPYLCRKLWPLAIQSQDVVARGGV